MEMNALMPQTKKIKLSFGEFEIKPLSIRQIIKLFAFSKPIQDEISKMTTGPQKDTTSNIDMVAKFVELFGDRLGEGLTVIMNTKELLTVDDISVQEALVIFNAIVEVNDFAEIKRSFLVATEKVTKKVAG